MTGVCSVSDTFNFSPAITQKASRVIYDQIRDMIVAGELKPGDKLPSERSMMDMMRRSRPTIREALRMLENSGLIQIIPGGRAIVREPPIASLQQPLESIMALQSISDKELFEYRFYIEEMTAAWAAQRRTENDLAAMRECMEASEQLVDDFDAFLKLEIHFRVLIAEASHNRLSIIMEKVIYNIVVNAMSMALALKSKARRREINMEVLEANRRIYDAIEARDSKLAREEIYTQSQVFLRDNSLLSMQTNR